MLIFLQPKYTKWIHIEAASLPNRNLLMNLKIKLSLSTGLQEVQWLPWKIKAFYKTYLFPNHKYVLILGRCGSCWTFSATGGIEAAVFRKTGKLPSLSEQYLVDCATAAGYGSGCNGGNENNAFDYIIKSKGIPFEADYPYQEKQGKCNKSIAKSTTMVKYTHVNANEADVAAALDKYGPLSIAIYASAQSFQLYKSGVYYEPACKNSYRDINHAVLLVGYGTENGVDYWLVKNSWGTTVTFYYKWNISKIYKPYYISVGRKRIHQNGQKSKK